MHSVCLWDEKGATKVHQALHEDILDFIRDAQAVHYYTHITLYIVFIHLKNLHSTPSRNQLGGAPIPTMVNIAHHPTPISREFFQRL